MTSEPPNPPNPKWPAYPSGPQDHVHAIGVITLNFNLFERAMFGLFSHHLVHAGLTFRECQLLLGEMNTKEKMETITFMFAEREKDPVVVEHVGHLIAYFYRCFENRNVIAHAALDTTLPRTDFLELFKSSKDDWSKINRYRLTLPDLRKIADEIRDGFRYLISLTLYLSGRDGLQAGMPLGPHSLPQKPRLPDTLTLHPHPAPRGAA